MNVWAGKRLWCAATMGTEAAVYAAEASDNNDLLERVLPAMVSDYVELVKAILMLVGVVHMVDLSLTF